MDSSQVTSFPRPPACGYRRQRFVMVDKKNDCPDKDGMKHSFSYDTEKRYPEAEANLDPMCIFEEMDRSDGMAVDDEKTYHRTEK